MPASHIKETLQTLPGTDQPPTVAVLTLEGTAGQTVTVERFVLDELAQTDAAMVDNPTLGDAARRFYTMGAATLVTVGATSFLRILPGKVYYRLTLAPAADARLKIGFAPGVPT